MNIKKSIVTFGLSITLISSIAITTQAETLANNANWRLTNQPITITRINKNTHKKKFILLPAKTAVVFHKDTKRIRTLTYKTTKTFKYVTSAKNFTYSNKPITESGNLLGAFYDQGTVWGKQISKSQKKAIYNYTNQSYKDINGYLRKYKTLTPQQTVKVKKDIIKIDSALNKFTMNNPMTTYRGSLLPVLNEAVKGGKLQVGATVKDPAYLSTSTTNYVVKNLFKTSVIMQLNFPQPGKYGAYISSISDYPSEQEFLVRRGQKFVVTGIKKNSKGILSVYLSAE
jgi:hypothetical protein